MPRVVCSSVLDELELSFGEEVFAVCDLGPVRYCCVMLRDDPTESVILAIAAGAAWIEHKRFTGLNQSLRAMGALLDKRWNEVPIDECGWPSPTLIIPRDRSLEVLYRTAAGVRNAVELSDRPGDLIHHDSVWPDFRSATRDLSDWAAYLE
jgi:hypothetical protein